MKLSLFTKFSEKAPPELCDLLVCNMAPDKDDREYYVAQFVRQGSLLKNEYKPSGNTWEERMLDSIKNSKSAWLPAPETGFYEYSANVNTGLCEWMRNRVDFRRVGYIIINPEDDTDSDNATASGSHLTIHIDPSQVKQITLDLARS